MFLSVFELFKIGIGPSSSHTVGPMVAVARFLDEFGDLANIGRVQAELFGSLAFTGKGHATDRAVVLGFAGFSPDAVDADQAEAALAAIAESGRLTLPGGPEIEFDAERDVLFNYGPALPPHPNGMTFRAFSPAGGLMREGTYFSVGGGFVATEEELGDPTDEVPDTSPYPFRTAAQLLAEGNRSGLTIAQMKRANELQHHEPGELEAGLDALWDAMNGCIDRGLANDGELPGGLHVKRRAKGIWEKLQANRGSNLRLEHSIMDWISVYAMAVNEENAAGGRVVTAPTNGAAGVIPSVLRYALDYCPGVDRQAIHTFLLTAAAIGGIIKINASISGAEVGCQGEVGSAAAMAAAGLCAVLGGTNMQIENAAEIAMEHHLGMTCDPVGGLVQVPCIERNALGAVKAVNAASLALQGDGTHFISLDTVVHTMRETGRDMSTKYKETSEGGLAVAVNRTAC